MDLVREIKQRDSKSCNIFIFNAPESSINDCDLVDNLLNALKLRLPTVIGNLTRKTK